MHLRTAALLALALVLATSACAPRQPVRRSVPRRPAAAPTPPPPMQASGIPWGQHTVASRLFEFGARSRWRWAPLFREARVPYPSNKVVLVAYKREKRMEVYAGPSTHQLALVRTLDIVATSGGPGPKLREGDRQVPEGGYHVDDLNPNSLYHVALRLDYPNEFDRRMGAGDRRSRLGNAIMIHGSDRSIGCLAMGDTAAEDLFTLAADVGPPNVYVLIVPRDFRRTGEHSALPGQPPWVSGLYAELDARLRLLPVPRPRASSPTGEARTAARRRQPPRP